jgi:antitoxin PrlF
MQLHYFSSRKAFPMILSSVTDRYQTTIPKGVRDALGIRRGDMLAYELSGDQVVLRRRVAEEAEDPALLGFLDLLERDIAAHLERLAPMPQALVDRARALVDGVDIDLDAAV